MAVVSDRIALAWCLALLVASSDADTECKSLRRRMTLCPGDCKQDELCYQSGDDCPYRCVKQPLGREHVEVHFRHGAYKSAKELELEDKSDNFLNQRDAQSGEHLDAPTNDDVNAIDVLRFSSKITAAWFVAGPFNQIKGYVVNVTLAPQMLTDTSVKFVVLKGLNVGETKPPLADILPPELRQLELSNTLLEEVPADLTLFTQLRSLKIEDNYLREIPESFTFPALKNLIAKNNELSTFDAKLPTLRELDLSDNNFSAIPSAIYEMKNLQKLDLTNNKLKNIWLTNDQHKFLTRPDLNVSLDRGIGDTSCDPSLVENVTTADNIIIPFCIDTAAPKEPATLSPSVSPSSTLEALATSVPSATPPATSEVQATSPFVATPVGIGSFVAVLLIGLLTVALWRYRASRDAKERRSTYTTAMDTDNKEAVNKASIASLLDDQKLLALRVDAAQLQTIKRLGTGAFGEVWLVTYRNTNLAAKRLIARANTDHVIKFISEIKLNASLSHSRIVRFEGAAWTTTSNLQALFEYMPRGDLRTWLLDPANGTDWSSEKMLIAMDIVEALVYVHSFSPPLVHRDLKSRNVLLSESLRAKVCDFGIARFQSSEGTMTVAMGTGLWLAPEVISGRRDYDHTADIWALGVVLSELDTHKLPYEDAKGPNGNNMHEMGVIHQVGACTLAPTFSSTCPSAIRRLAERCLSFDPSERPTAIMVACTLEEIYNNKAYEVL